MSYNHTIKLQKIELLDKILLNLQNNPDSVNHEQNHISY